VETVGVIEGVIDGVEVLDTVTVFVGVVVHVGDTEADAVGVLVAVFVGVKVLVGVTVGV
tara:strand:- start:127 stop:303 length:177 start_codon:yes stop_codon:yes gene_type:complete